MSHEKKILQGTRHSLAGLVSGTDNARHRIVVEETIVRPSVVLDRNRDAVRELTGLFRTANPRVFGSVLHGTDKDGSDLDLLVDALPGATLLHLGDLQDELKSLLGVDVDVLTPGDLPPKYRAKVLAEAQPV